MFGWCTFVSSFAKNKDFRCNFVSRGHDLICFRHKFVTGRSQICDRPGTNLYLSETNLYPAGVDLYFFDVNLYFSETSLYLTGPVQWGSVPTSDKRYLLQNVETLPHLHLFNNQTPFLLFLPYQARFTILPGSLSFSLSLWFISVS